MDFYLGSLKSKFDLRDWKIEKVFKSIAFSSNLPETFSLVDKLFPVRNQGTLGSCVAMTVSTIKDYQEKIDSKIEGYTSPLYVYSQRMTKPFSGMYPRDAMSILYTKGISLEKEFPYVDNEKLISIPSSELIKNSLPFAIKSYAKVKTIDGMKKALIAYGPCMIVVDVYNYGSSLWKKERVEDIKVGKHAMTIVGYDELGFIVRNSWGTSWANKGYTILPYEDFKFIKEAWSAVDGDSAKLYKERNYLSTKIKKWIWIMRVPLIVGISVLSVFSIIFYFAIKFS